MRNRFMTIFFKLDLDLSEIPDKGRTVNNFVKLNVQNAFPKINSNKDGLFSATVINLMDPNSKFAIPLSLKQDVIRLNERYLRI